MLTPDVRPGTRCPAVIVSNISNNHLTIYMKFYVHQDPDQTGKKTAKESADAMSDYIIHHAFWKWKEKIIQQARYNSAKNPSYKAALKCFLGFMFHD